MNIRKGFVAGEPIRWHAGPAASDSHFNIAVMVWLGAQIYMHTRPVPRLTSAMSKEIWLARVKRELINAEEQLRSRAYGRVTHA